MAPQGWRAHMVDVRSMPMKASCDEERVLALGFVGCGEVGVG